MIGIWRACGKYVFVIGAIGALYWGAQLPTIADSERAALASRFRFVGTDLPTVTAPADFQPHRTVHPKMKRIEGWISGTGAAVALTDLDGDGLPNDCCYVDPRSDEVIVCSAPGRRERFAPFVLDGPGSNTCGDGMAPMGCIPSDMNEDGAMDVLVYYWGRTPVAFLRTVSEDATQSRSITAASYVARPLLAEGEWYTSAATFADLDGDSHAELIVGNYFPDNCELLHPDSTKPATMHDSMSRALNGGLNRILRWRGATTGDAPTVDYEVVTGALDDVVINAWTLAVGAADLDGDLLPELYFANDFGPDRLLHNRSTPGSIKFALLNGVKHFDTPNSKTLGRDSFKGMGIDFGDLNNDGLLDMYVSNIADEYALEESHFAWCSTGDTKAMAHGVAPYDEKSEDLGVSRSGWGWETRLDDFDNDGNLEAVQATGFMKGDVDRWPELHEVALGNDNLVHRMNSWPHFVVGDDLSGHEHDPFFVRAADGRMYDLAGDVGLSRQHNTRGIATADVDGDGDIDLAFGNQWEPSVFYENQGTGDGAFLGLHVRVAVDPEMASELAVTDGHPTGTIPSRPAIGAQAVVHLDKNRVLTAQVDGGNGHSGVRSPDLHFGLGDHPADQPVRVELSWRDGSGGVRRETLELTPGWHTIILGAACVVVRG